MRLRPDFHYRALWEHDAIEMIDTATKRVVGRIPVGQNPRGVFLQGDARSKEYYDWADASRP